VLQALGVSLSLATQQTQAQLATQLAAHTNGLAQIILNQTKTLADQTHHYKRSLTMVAAQLCRFTVAAHLQLTLVLTLTM
jgi:hypothetical protein